MAVDCSDKELLLWQRAVFKAEKTPRGVVDSLRMRIHLLQVYQDKKYANKQ